MKRVAVATAAFAAALTVAGITAFDRPGGVSPFTVVALLGCFVAFDVLPTPPTVVRVWSRGVAAPFTQQ